MPEPAFQRRKDQRLPAFDYASAGYYFVTVCTAGRNCWLATISGETLDLTFAGTVVETTWQATVEVLSGVTLDAFVVMPNHVHAIVVLGEAGNQGVINAAPTRLERAFDTGAQPGAPQDAAPRIKAAGIHPPLGEVVRRLKAASALAVRKAVVSTFGWQRGYFEHVIRDERTLDRVREYIADNPRKWAEDPENPERPR